MPVQLRKEKIVDCSFLEVDCTIRKGTRLGKVTAIRDEGAVVDWEEWTHPVTGEILEAGPDIYENEVIHLDHLYGHLEVVRRPMSFQQTRSVNEVQRDECNHKETERMLVRKACVLAGEELIAEDLIGVTRVEYERNALQLVHRARSIHARIAVEAQPSNRPHPFLSPSDMALHGSQVLRKPFQFKLTGENAKAPRYESKMGAPSISGRANTRIRAKMAFTTRIATAAPNPGILTNFAIS